MDEDNYSNIYTRRRVMGIVLFSAFVASWFVWGPLGLICYVSGLFNSLMAFALIPLLVGLLLVGATVLLPIAVIHTILRWRKLLAPQRLLECCFIGVIAAFVTSFALGFTGMQPLPIEMFARGFARYAASREDVPAIQMWLSTLDPKAYTEENGDITGRPFAAPEQPPCIARLHPKTVKLQQDEKGRLIVRLLWGGGMIGHWGIEVADKSVEPPPASESIGYRPLAPGAWIWYEN